MRRQSERPLKLAKAPSLRRSALGAGSDVHIKQKQSKRSNRSARLVRTLRKDTQFLAERNIELADDKTNVKARKTIGNFRGRDFLHHPCNPRSERHRQTP